MTLRSFIASLAAVASLALTVPAVADENPTNSGLPLNAAENAFVKSIQADLGQRFATAADAEKAGYKRYTDPDDTGAISYANLHWTSTDAKHPSQLWYDSKGVLLGADFSQPATSSARPHWLGIDPGRWAEFDDHIHYVARDPKTGKLIYDKYISIKDFKAAGGDPMHPTAATVVKLGKVKSASDVVWVFDFPSIWDLIVWVRPNPNGAFAEKNPAVIGIRT